MALGPRSIPWNRAIRWSAEARGLVSGRIDWRLRWTGSRLMTKDGRCLVMARGCRSG
jgi:hypothetical protein